MEDDGWCDVCSIGICNLVGFWLLACLVIGYDAWKLGLELGDY